ncbi:hypothetical protein ACTFIV_000551 [Dictyostelium citrinum]
MINRFNRLLYERELSENGTGINKLKDEFSKSNYSIQSLEKTELNGHNECVNSINFNEDGSLIVSGGDDETVRIWDVGKRKCLTTLYGHSTNVFATNFLNNDNRKIISGGNDADIRYYDIENQKCTVYKHHSKKVLKLSVCPTQPQVFLSSSSDGTVRLFDVRLKYKDTEIQPIQTAPSNDIGYRAILPQVIGGGRGRTMALPPRQRQQQSNSTATTTDSPSSPSSSSINANITTNTTSTSSFQSSPSSSNDNSIKYGNSLLINFDPLPLRRSFRYSITIPKTTIFSVEYHPYDGYSFITASSDGTVRLFDQRMIPNYSSDSFVNIYRNIETPFPSENEATGCAFSKNGNEIVVTYLNDNVYLYDLKKNYSKEYSLDYLKDYSNQSKTKTKKKKRSNHSRSLTRSINSSNGSGSGSGSGSGGSGHDSHSSTRRDSSSSIASRNSSNESGNNENNKTDTDSSNENQIKNTKIGKLSKKKRRNKKKAKTDSDISLSSCSNSSIGSSSNSSNSGGSSNSNNNNNNNIINNNNTTPPNITNSPTSSLNDETDNSDSNFKKKNQKEEKEIEYEEKEFEEEYKSSKDDQREEEEKIIEKGINEESESESENENENENEDEEGEQEIENDDNSENDNVVNDEDELDSDEQDISLIFDYYHQLLVDARLIEQRENDDEENSTDDEDSNNNDGDDDDNDDDDDDDDESDDSYYGNESDDEDKDQDDEEDSENNKSKPFLPKTFKQVYSGHVSEQTIKSVNFYGPNSEYIISGSDDSKIFIWDKESAKIVRILEGHENHVNSVVCHPNEPCIATSGIDPYICLWEPTKEYPDETEMERRKKTINHYSTLDRYPKRDDISSFPVPGGCSNQ